MLPARYHDNSLSVSPATSLALADNTPHLGLRGPARSPIRGIALENRSLRLICDESVSIFDLLADKAVLDHTVLMPQQSSRIFMAQPYTDETPFFSNHAIMTYDRTERSIKNIKKIPALQSVSAWAGGTHAANSTHYFEVSSEETRKIRLPGRVAMTAIVAAGHLFYVEQWDGPQLVAYRLQDGRWHRLDQVDQPVEWHFPGSSVFIAYGQVMISIAKTLYTFDLKAARFAKAIELSIEPAILTTRNMGEILACDGRKIVELNSGKTVYQHAEPQDEITALCAINAQIYFGTLKGGLWRSHEHDFINLLPASAFCGPVEVSTRDTTVAFSSASHDLEIQCTFGGGPSLLPAEKLPNQSGSTMQGISSQLDGSRLFIRRFGELKNIIDVKDTYLAIACRSKVFTVDRQNRLNLTGSDGEAEYLGSFPHSVRALECRANALGGYTLLAADTKPGHYTILELNQDRAPIHMESVKADIVVLADSKTYVRQKGRRVTVIHRGRPKILGTGFYPLQTAALVNGLLFLVHGGQIEVFRFLGKEFRMIARVTITLDHAYLTHFPGQALTYDKYQSGQFDRLVQAYRKNGCPVAEHELSLLMITSQKQGFVFEGVADET